MNAPPIPEGYGIDNPWRRAHFLAQLAHESGGFSRLTENLNYSADRIRQLGLAARPGTRWRSLVPRADALARRPEDFAEAVYGGRLGNAPEGCGDGWRFRGRGYIQLTGRANYTDFSRRVFGDDRLVHDPDMAALPAVAMMVAGEYWQAKGLNALADADDIEGITRRINGGLNGLADRKRWLATFKGDIA